MKLIASLTSPYVRKVRIVLAEKKLDYELVLDDVWSSTTTIQQYNPLGQVPCLVMDDGGTLFDSRVIVEYLDTLSPVGRLIPQGNRDRTAVKRLEAVADGIMDACVAINLEKQREPVFRSQAWIDRQHSKIEAALGYLDQDLNPQMFCLGVNFSLADIAVGCALAYLDLRHGSFDWRSRHQNLAELHEKLEARPTFEANPFAALTSAANSEDSAGNDETTQLVNDTK